MGPFSQTSAPPLSWDRKRGVESPPPRCILLPKVLPFFSPFLCLVWRLRGSSLQWTMVGQRRGGSVVEASPFPQSGDLVVFLI